MNVFHLLYNNSFYTLYYSFITYGAGYDIIFLHLHWRHRYTLFNQGKSNIYIVDMRNGCRGFDCNFICLKKRYDSVVLIRLYRRRDEATMLVYKLTGSETLFLIDWCSNFVLLFQVLSFSPLTLSASTSCKHTCSSSPHNVSTK